MLTLTRNGVVILLLIGILFQDMTQVEGLDCYICDDTCADNGLKVNEDKCPIEDGITYYCFKTKNVADSKYRQGCISKEMLEAEKIFEDVKHLRNDCAKVKTVDEGEMETCLCDTDLCNGADSPRSIKNSPSTSTTIPSSSLVPVPTMALSFSLSAIAIITITG